MKKDKKGSSTCPLGQERIEKFKYRNKTMFQYDYRYLDGELFSCIAPNIETARIQRNNYRQVKSALSN